MKIPALHLRLYVIRPAPNSLRAIENLSEIMRDEVGGEGRVEIVDVSDDPAQALLDGVLVTPTLVRLAPPPLVKIIGDLSDRPAVITSLLQT